MTQASIAAVATVLCVLSVMPKAAAHSGDTASGIPGWVLLFSSVIGIWIIIGIGVVVSDQILQHIADYTA